MDHKPMPGTPGDKVLQNNGLESSENTGFEEEFNIIMHAIGHDVRAPLRSISGFALAIEEDYAGKLDATALDYLHRIRGGAKRMDSMLEGILTLCRLKNTTPLREHADISHMAGDILTGLAEQRPDRHLEIDIAPGLVAGTDRALLRIVLHELIENAWKFTSEAPVTRIAVARVAAPKEKFVVGIRDNGVGFDAEAARGKLFGLFERFHAPERFPGDGVGLAVARSAARRLGGSIKAESHPGRGALFICEITDHPECRRI